MFLVLSWITPLFMAKPSLKAKFQEAKGIKYREEDPIINEPASCTPLQCKDGSIDISRHKWGMKRKKMSKVLY